MCEHFAVRFHYILQYFIDSINVNTIDCTLKKRKKKKRLTGKLVWYKMDVPVCQTFNVNPRLRHKKCIGDIKQVSTSMNPPPPIILGESIRKISLFI